MKNKIIHTSIILALSMGMIACSNSSNSEDSNKTEEKVVEKEEKKEVNAKEIKITSDNFWDYFEIQESATSPTVSGGSNDGALILSLDDSFGAFNISMNIKDEYLNQLVESKMDEQEDGTITFHGTYQFESITFNEDGTYAWNGKTISPSNVPSMNDGDDTMGLNLDNTFTETDTISYQEYANDTLKSLKIYLPNSIFQDQDDTMYYTHIQDVVIDSVSYTIWLKS